MARTTKPENVRNFKHGTLESDNLYINPRLESVSDLTGMPTRMGIEKFLTVDETAGKPTDGRIIIANVSNKYGFLANENYYPQIEERLESAGFAYLKRSINRQNRSFTVDYVLNDDSMHVNIKKGKDLVKPMMRFVNSYDGSNQTTGHFGFFREICSNGLHIADTQLKFKVRHRGNMLEIVMPKIEDLIVTFMDNEYYSLHKKFEGMAEKALTDVDGFVKYTLGKTGLFKYEKSEKNPEEASIGAQFIIDTINAEAKELGTAPNLWLGYNAFNEYIHTQNNKQFALQEQADRKLFDAVLAQVN